MQKLIAIILLGLIISCTSTRYSNKRSGEQLAIRTIQHEKPLVYTEVTNDMNLDATRSLITAELLLKGVDFAFEGIKVAIKKGAERYHQEYFFSLFNNTFYAQNSQKGMLDPEHIKFKGFEIERSVKLKDGRTAALYASFSMDEEKYIDLYTQSKFYLKCDSFHLAYSKVKLNDKDWYLPWTYFFKEQTCIDMDLEIDVLANWIDPNGVIHKQITYGKFYLPIRNYKVNSIDSTIAGRKLSGYSYLIPRSTSFCMDKRGNWETCYGQGDFDLLVKVTESSKNNSFNKVLYDNVDLIDDIDHSGVKDLIKN